jgi:hypothetical protein
MGVLYKKKKYKLQGGSKLLEDDALVKQDATQEVVQPKQMVTGEPKKMTRQELMDTGLVNNLVFSVKESPEMMANLDRIAPKRFSMKYVDYDKHDDAIMAAATELEELGEEIDPNVIKAIMITENSDLVPKKNKLGYEGFPQTKSYIVDSINKRYGTKFTMKDMYDPKESAKFIHYYLKDVNRSMYVNDIADTVAAYNWGIGNLIKMKRGERSMPKETSDYIQIIKTLLNK